MKYEVSKRKGGVDIKFTYTAQEWESEIQSVFKKNAKKFNIQGFRKGQAPRRIIERFYGETVFFDDAFDECAKKGYAAALSENEDILPVDRPEVDVESFPQGDKPLVFIMKVTVRPEVVLGAYTGMKCEKAEYTVTDTDVEAELSRVQQRASRKVTVTDRPVKDGDTVTLDYSGSVGGIKFEGGTAEGQTLKIGSNSFIPGFEEQMIGMTIGEERDLTVSFPADYHAEELKGKEAVFKVKVHGIEFDELPEINDEFARDRSKFDSLSEYKADIAARLQKENESRAESENRSAILDKAVDNAACEIPDCMIDEELEFMLDDMRQKLQYMYGGMKIEDYFKYTGSSVEDYKKQHTDDAKKSVKTRLVVQEIIKAEKLEVADSDIDAEIKKGLPEGKDFAEHKASLTHEQISRLRNDILIQKLFEFLFEKNSFEKKAVQKPAAGEKKSATGEKKPAVTEKKPSAAKKPASKKE